MQAVTFSVSSPDPSQRQLYAEWSETVLKQVVHADFTPAEQRPAYVAGWGCDFGGVQAGRMRSSGGVSIRTRAHLDDADDRFNLLVPTGDNDIVTVQRGLNAQVRDGGAAIVRMDEPAEIQFRQEHDAYLLFLPRKALLSRLPSFNDRDAARALRGGPKVALLRRYLAMMEASLGDLDADTAAMMAEQVTDIVISVLLSNPDNRHLVDTGGARQLRMQAIETYARQCYRDPRINVSTCADCLGLSKSYIQLLLAERGTNFRDMLKAVRVEAACAMLAEMGPQRSIIDIAYDCGFADLSTFHRAFRALRAETPGDFQQRRRLQS